MEQNSVYFQPKTTLKNVCGRLEPSLAMDLKEKLTSSLFPIPR